MFVDQNGIGCFVDQNGVTDFIDQNGVFLTCAGGAQAPIGRVVA